jgi:hypothetical protein
MMIHSLKPIRSLTLQHFVLRYTKLSTALQQLSYDKKEDTFTDRCFGYHYKYVEDFTEPYNRYLCARYDEIFAEYYIRHIYAKHVYKFTEPYILYIL